MDPYAVLGLTPAASPDEVAAAYRRLAKRHHPDRTGGAGQARMAQLNAAYEQLRGHRPAAGPPRTPTAGRHAGPAPGHWLPEKVRWLLGRELVAALAREEPVRWLAHTSTWASPHTVLAVTDRRLLWLLDDAVAHRVRELRFAVVGSVAVRRQLRRDRLALRVQPRWASRRWTFSDLRPDIAREIVAHVRAAQGDGGSGGATRRGTS